VTAMASCRARNDSGDGQAISAMRMAPQRPLPTPCPLWVNRVFFERGVTLTASTQ